MEIKLENKENLEFVSLKEVTKKLGQAQYVSVFLNPNEKLHNDGTPYFSDIRIDGKPDDYHNLKIHTDDVGKFIEKWFEYKKNSSPFFNDKKLEDFL
jgi:hypothetical protein